MRSSCFASVTGSMHSRALQRVYSSSTCKRTAQPRLVKPASSFLRMHPAAIGRSPCRVRRAPKEICLFRRTESTCLSRVMGQTSAHHSSTRRMQTAIRESLVESMRKEMSTRRRHSARRSARPVCEERRHRTAYRSGFRAMEPLLWAAFTTRRSAHPARHRFFRTQAMFGLSMRYPTSFTQLRVPVRSSMSSRLALDCPPLQDKLLRHFPACPRRPGQAPIRLPCSIVCPVSRVSTRSMLPTIGPS